MQINTNILNQSKSLYLLQHANNPIHWLDWETYLKQSNTNKLVIISIGYSACHWCHVMEHESFENQEVANFMNANFLCVKVDREEHPQIDKLYMQACRVMTGGGGWPLNVICTPDKVPIHAGTYFSKDRWLQLLASVQQLYKNETDKINEFKTSLIQALKPKIHTVKQISFLDLKNSLLNGTQLLDWENGGLNGTPKFPMPVLLASLKSWASIFEDKKWEQFVNFTLLKMINGGLWDCIDGGFARYSVDNKWFIPHFEKMLYDNAQLLPLYASTANELKIPALQQNVQLTLQFLENEFKQLNGLYAAALDADTPDGEGAYYCLTLKEAKAIFNPTELAFCVLVFNLTEIGNWEHGLNILAYSKPPQLLLNELNLNAIDFEKIELACKLKISELRKTKIKPGLDTKCICAWNGLLLNGLAKTALFNINGLQMAIDLANSMEVNFIKSDALNHQLVKDFAMLNATLDDYAFYIQGLLSLFNTTQNTSYFTQALKVYNLAKNNHFVNSKWQFNAKNEQYFTQILDTEDNVTPSAFSTMALNELYLGVLIGDTTILNAAFKAIEDVTTAILAHPFWHAQWINAWLLKKANVPIIVASNENALALLLHNQNNNLPNTVLIILANNQIPIANNKFNKSENCWYICNATSCLNPLNSVEQVLDVITDYFS